MLQVTDLSKTFGSGDTEVTAVDGVSFTVPTGVFAAVVGRSGSGKSTLLSLLGALDKPTSGTIEVDGEVISRGSDHQLIRYRRNQIGFIFQSYNLIPNLSAIQNVMLPMEFAGVSKSASGASAPSPSSTRSGSRAASSNGDRRSCPAANSSASPSPAHSPTGRR